MRKLGVHIPHWQRIELFELCLRQLRNLNTPGWEVEIAVAGPDCQHSRAIVSRHGGRYVAVPNDPLGAKCNAAVGLLRDCDAVMGLGSDDLLCSRGARALLAALDDHDMAGFLDVYLYDLQRHKLWYWPGYQGRREGETVGPGRVVKRWLMDELDWAPFADELNCNLDRSMFEKLAAVQFKRAVLRCRDEDCLLVDVKTRTNINSMQHILQFAEGYVEVEQPWRVLGKHLGPDRVDDLHEIMP